MDYVDCSECGAEVEFDADYDFEVECDECGAWLEIIERRVFIATVIEP